MDKVNKMLQYARQKHAEKHRDDELSFLSQLPTDVLVEIASGNMTDEKLSEVMQNVNQIKNEDCHRSTQNSC